MTTSRPPSGSGAPSQAAREADGGSALGQKLAVVRTAAAHAFPARRLEHPMYLIGAKRPNKHAARGLLERAIIDGESLVTDAEVFQEILHRYSAIDRRDAIGPAFEALLGVVDSVHPIEQADTIRARALVERDTRLSARDAIHVAVMERRSIDSNPELRSGVRCRPGVARLTS